MCQTNPQLLPNTIQRLKASCKIVEYITAHPELSPFLTIASHNIAKILQLIQHLALS